MSEILQAKIATVRRKQVVVAVATGAAAAAAAFVLLLSISMLLDFWFNLPFEARAALLAVNLAAVVSIILYSVVGPVLYGPDDDEIALMVEDAEPAFRTRLIASIQLSRPAAAPAGASPSLIRAMVAQAESLAGPMDFGRVIRTEALTRLVVMALTIVVLFASVCAWGRELSGELMKRSLFLSDVPVPRKTGIIVLTGSPLVAKGDPIEILAIAERVYPPEGTRVAYTRTLAADGSRGAKRERTLEPVVLDQPRKEAIAAVIRASGRPKNEADDLIARLEASPAVFGVKLDAEDQSFEYTVRLNDAESPKHTVRVTPRPAIVSIETTELFPAYTRLAPARRRPEVPRMLRGSKLKIAITANKALSTDAGANVVRLAGAKPVALPLAVDPANPTLLSGEVEVPKGTTGYSIGLTAADGLASRDETVYRIDLAEDKAPAVRITAPTQKEVQTVQAAIHTISFKATDDYRVESVAIKYKIDEGTETPIPLALATMKVGDEGKSVSKDEHEWMLGDLRVASSPTNPNGAVPEGSVIEYWVEARDNRDAANGGPNTGASEHFMIRIVSKETKKKQIQGQMAEIGSALHTTTDDQENEAKRVQGILMEKKAGPATGPASRPATPAPK